MMMMQFSTFSSPHPAVMLNSPCKITQHRYIPRLSLNLTWTVIGWFLVTRPWLNSNVSRAWYNSAIVPRSGYNSTWSKHAGEKHCQFSLSRTNSTKMTNMEPQAKKKQFSKLSLITWRDTAADRGKNSENARKATKNAVHVTFLTFCNEVIP